MDNRYAQFLEKQAKSNKTKRGFKYHEVAGSQDQPRSDKHKNKRRTKAAKYIFAEG
jgi:hypothetical protein